MRVLFKATPIDTTMMPTLLSERRLARGFSQMDAANALNLRLEAIQALEYGNPDFFGDAGFADIFLCRYACWLQLTADELAALRVTQQTAPVVMSSSTPVYRRGMAWAASLALLVSTGFAGAPMLPAAEAMPVVSALSTISNTGHQSAPETVAPAVTENARHLVFTLAANVIVLDAHGHIVFAAKTYPGMRVTLPAPAEELDIVSDQPNAYRLG